jgi:flagellar hook-length control protein FliK
MDIQPTLLSASLPNKAVSLNLPQWMLGQVLNATVSGRKSADTLLLQINNQAIEAKTNSNKPIYIGAQLKLVVEQQGSPAVLRVLQQESPKLIQETKQQLLRENIPKQASMEKLTSILNQTIKNPSGIIKGLTAPIEQQIKKLIDQLPTQINLKNEPGLKSAIKNSGIFLESKLLAEVTKKQNTRNQAQTIAQSNSPNIAKDLKTNLLQLSELITKYKQDTQKPVPQLIKPAQVMSLFEGAKSQNTNTKPDVRNTAVLIDIDSKVDIETISKQLESSIARIEVNQSKAVVTHDNQLPAWSIELPVKDKQDIDLLKLDIQHDKKSKPENDKEQIWTVNLKINFQDKGAVSARLSILDKEVSATLWSEDQRLNDLIDNNLSLLSKRIENCGLSMGKIVCLAGSPARPDEHMSADNLINISV